MAGNAASQCHHLSELAWRWPGCRPPLESFLDVLKGCLLAGCGLGLLDEILRFLEPFFRNLTVPGMAKSHHD